MFRKHLLLALLTLFVVSSSAAQQRYTLQLDAETAFSDFAQIPPAGVAALIGADINRMGALLVVQDTKSIQGVVRPNSGIGLAVVTTAGVTYEEVSISWPVGEAASDLEALCHVPNTENEFLLAESGYFRGKFGRIFHVRLTRTGGRWSATLIGSVRMPMDVRSVEGMACVAEGEEVLVVLGERGGPTLATNGQFRWTILDLGALPATLSLSNVAFDSDGFLRLSRDITGMYRDPAGLLWVSSAEDLDADFGPFRSAVQLVGSLQFHRTMPLSLRSTPVPVYYSRTKKIEGVGPGLFPGVALSVATEDEHLGGTWFALNWVWGLPFLH